MSQRLILHIGANKTGSSAIQTFLRQNAKLLRDLGYLVPDKELGMTGPVSGEHVFAYQDMINRSDRQGMEAKIKAWLETDAKAIITSSENLSNDASFRFFNKLLPANDCKVILYIRRQDEMLTSSWQQWNSKRETDFNAWLILALQSVGHWQRCIDGWETVVGPGNVTVRVFQKSDLVGGDVVDDFIALLGLNNHGVSFTRTSALVNPSYSDLITPLVSGSKFIFKNGHDNEFYDMVQKLTGDHYSVQKRVSLLTPQQRDKIIEYYRGQNESVCRKYFPGRPRLFDPVDHSKYDYLTPDQLNRRQLEFLASLVFALYKKKS